MAKYKKCPNCGMENEPSSIECVGCGVDLSAVPLFDTEAVVAEPVAEDASEQENHDVELVKVCPSCSEANPPQARKCLKCGEDISDITPAQDTNTDAEERLTYMLSSVFGDYHFRVPCSGTIIGREHGMRDCLSEKRFVSRTHARLFVEDGELYVENLSSTNYTYINNKRIAEGKNRLQVGDEVGLGGIVVNGSRQDGAAYFIVGLAP